MNNSFIVRGMFVGLMVGLICLTGCPAPTDDGAKPLAGSCDGSGGESTRGDTLEAPARPATATPEDVQAVAHNVLRHRLLLSYEAETQGLTADDLISELLGLVPLL